MRNLCAAFLSAVLLTTSALAAGSNTGPLAPGKPAGVKEAQTGSEVALIVVGVAALAMGAALVGGSGGGGGGSLNNQNGQGGGTTATST
jgi:hypothetical protein